MPPKFRLLNAVPVSIGDIFGLSKPCWSIRLLPEVMFLSYFLKPVMLSTRSRPISCGVPFRRLEWSSVSGLTCWKNSNVGLAALDW